MKEVKTEVTMFACEVCNALYPKRKTADLCERQHRAPLCKHLNVTYRVKRSKEFGIKAILLLKECADCNTYHELELSSLSSESLGTLWHLVTGLFDDQRKLAAHEAMMKDPNGKALQAIFEGIE